MTDMAVDSIPTDNAAAAPSPGIALCLSGGGYRAMVFHIGVLWRLREAGILTRLDRISSVSGGSITAGMLALRWGRIDFNDAKSFVDHVVKPLRGLASTTLDAESIIEGLVLPGSVADRVADEYDDHLFDGATLQDLPDRPRFVINATNVQSGALWRFSKPYMRDYRVGEVKQPRVRLAQAVAASSAFPPVLSPLKLKVDPASFTPDSGMDLQREPFTRKVLLTDGGVYDNMGIETAWKQFQTILVSDAGGKMKAEEEPKTDWARHAYRVLDMVDNQVRSLRKRALIEAFRKGEKKGAYWGIRTNIADYALPSALPVPHARSMELAEIATRLKRMDGVLQERLINWGYAVCDAAIRKHFDATLPAPTPAGLPYPGVQI